MPLSHVSKVFAVKDAKISKMLTDPAGGSATYAASVDVPAIKSVTITGDIKTVELRGDNKKQDQQSVLTGIACSFEHGKLSLDALAVMLSSTVTDTGVTPSQVASLDILGATTFNYFRLEAQAVGADTIGGDVIFSLWKCVLSDFPELGLEEEDYKTSTVGVAALPRISDDKWLTPSLRETSVALT